jgi:hypothetical protein
MERKTLLIVLIIAVLVAGISLIFYFNNTSTKPVFELTPDKLITNQTLIDRIIVDMNSPLGNNLTRITLEEDDINASDRSWKYAYYVCISNEHRGWIYFHSGKSGENKLYGPYAWCFV